MLPSSLQEQRPPSRKSPIREVGDRSRSAFKHGEGNDLKDPQPSGWGIAGSRCPFPVGRSEGDPNLPVGGFVALFTQSRQRVDRSSRGLQRMRLEREGGSMPL